MPRGDGTGPMGLGPMTGRGAGYCAGFASPGYVSPLGYGRGLGRGRGFRRMYYATGLPRWTRYEYPENPGANGAAINEKTYLNNQAEYLEDQLQQVKKRLSSLKEEES